MTSGTGRQMPSVQNRLCLIIKVAAIMLALVPAPVRSARRAFVGDLESKGTASRSSSRKLLADDNEFHVIDSVGFDVLETIRKEYNPDIGCYGGYGIYGYYGYWYGVYGTYNDNIFVDYTFDPEGYTSIEMEGNEWSDRRMLSEEDYVFGVKPYEIDVEDSFLDYQNIVTPTYTFTYAGEGWGRYYGYAPLYFGKYNGETYFDYESLNDLIQLQEWIEKALRKETAEQAREDLEQKIKDGDWEFKVPTRSQDDYDYDYDYDYYYRPYSK